MKVRTASTVAVLVLAASAAGCGPHRQTTGQAASPGSASQAASASGLPVDDPSFPMPAAGTCHLGSHLGQPLPDAHCTPGAINPAVSQADIGQTICATGWTKTVRPAVSKTKRMKAESARAYGLTPDQTGEYDHLVSLELGGAPDDVRNLWLEPGKIPNPKDAVENKLNAAVCSGLIPLASAQKAIATRWTTAFDDAGLRVSGGKVCLRADSSRCATGRHGDNQGE